MNLINTLPGAQFGFRSGIVTASFNVINDNVLLAADRGNVTVLILLDFGKALDSIRVF